MYNWLALHKWCFYTFIATIICSTLISSGSSVVWYIATFSTLYSYRMDVRALLPTMCLMTAVISQPQPPLRINPAVIRGAGNTGACPSSDTLESTRQNISEVLRQTLIDPCGAGWSLVTSLDLDDPSQQCPSPWVETPTPQRSCAADYSDSCIGLSFP